MILEKRRPFQILCKLLIWCKIEAPYWLFNYEQHKKTQSGRTSLERKDSRTPANQRSQQQGGYPESLQGKKHLLIAEVLMRFQFRMVFKLLEPPKTTMLWG